MFRLSVTFIQAQSLSKNIMLAVVPGIGKMRGVLVVSLLEYVHFIVIIFIVNIHSRTSK